MTPRAVLACPGRGSYAAASLGSLPPEHPWVVRAEQLRAGYELEPLLELDRAPRFDPARHLQPVHASPLIFLVSMLDTEKAVADHQITAVIGNSLGWYTALAVAGALPFDDAFRLVQEMAILQQEPLPTGGPGGQVIYPLADAAWRPDPTLRAAVADVLADPAAISLGKATSRWAIMARSVEALGAIAQDARWKPVPPRPTPKAWTDDFSNPLSLVRWMGN